MGIHKGFIFILLSLICVGCAAHRTATISRDGDRIKLQIKPPGGSPTLKCLTCNQEIPPLPISFDDQGIAFIKIDEASSAIVTHFHLVGSGIDSAMILQPPSPDYMTTKYNPAQRVTGRAVINRYSVIYKDTTMIESLGSLERQDEVNLFGEDDVFYYIHHPRYIHPVVILRSHAVRIK